MKNTTDALISDLDKFLTAKEAGAINSQQIFDVVKPFLENVWAPIETAPKDGSIITLWCEKSGEVLVGCQFYRGCWKQFGEDAVGTRGFYRLQSEDGQIPTHWISLLPPLLD